MHLKIGFNVISLVKKISNNGTLHLGEHFLSVLFQLAAGPGPKNFNSPYRSLWIGLTDVDVEGRYVWNSTGDVTTYTFWVNGQPNNYLNQDYCVLNSDEIGRWHDVHPTYEAASMCEQTLTPTLPSNHQWPVL